MNTQAKRYSCAVITISDKGAAGLRADTSGETLQRILGEHGFENTYYTIIPDDENTIVRHLLDCADTKKTDLIVTTGGTGLSPRDVTPDATLRVIDKEIPGMAEAMRAASCVKTINAIISRAVVGTRKNSIIINLPGSQKAAAENIEVLLPALPHALAKLQGDPSDCGAAVQTP